jgi:hypothetical protein
LRQRRTIDTLGAEDVDVVEFDELFGGKCFRRSERHVPGVVHHDVEPPLFGNDPGNRGIGRGLRADVELDGMQIDVVIRSVFLHVGDLGRVAAPGIAHRGVNRVACLGQCVGGKPAEAAGSTSDNDNLFHDTQPFPREVDFRTEG